MFSYLAHVICTIVVVYRAIVARKAEWTLTRVVRCMINALGSVVTRIEVFGTKLDFRLTIVTYTTNVKCLLRRCTFQNAIIRLIYCTCVSG